MENVKLTFRDEKNRRLGKRKRIRKKKKEIHVLIHNTLE